MKKAKIQQIPRILYLEDNLYDREIVAEVLTRHGFDCELIFAATAAEFEAAVTQPGLDLILSDFTIPSFSGTAALAMARKTLPNVPFLFVSGTIGEERAIESFKSGVTD